MTKESIKADLEKLLEVGAHFGHQTKRWNPKMEPYIFGSKGGVHIFDLVKTKEALDLALGVLAKASREGKTILFVGTKKQAKNKVKEICLALGCPYVNERWLGGTLTNFDQILATVRKLTELKEKLSRGEFGELTKKEILLLNRKVEKMERTLGGLSQLTRLPDLIVIIDTHKEVGCLREANRMGIETIGVVDSNSDPGSVTYPIPMNDDASKVLDYTLDLMREAVLSGKSKIKGEKSKVQAKSKS
jgi:small subunit ribosomal protein S2